jgi:hypothetical protein
MAMSYIMLTPDPKEACSATLRSRFAIVCISIMATRVLEADVPAKLQSSDA